MATRNSGIPSENIFFEDILPKTGWGLYYKFMLGLTILCHFLLGATLVSFSFAIPMWMCEKNAEEHMLLITHSSFVAGRAFGGYILNSLSDIYGRKRVINSSLGLIFVATFVAAFVYNYYTLVMAAFLLGTGFENHTAVIRVHLAEILHLKRRGLVLAVCDVFWTFGYIFVSVFTFLMRNPVSSVDKAGYRFVDMKLSTWRILFALSGGLSLFLACASALLEESPRYFLIRGKNYLAHLILKQFYAINKSSYAENFEVKESELSNIINDYDLPFALATSGSKEELKRIMRIIFKSIKLLFSKSLAKSCLIMLAIKTPLLIFGTLDVNILLAKHLTSRTIADGMDVVYLMNSKNTSMCSEEETDKSLYLNFFIIAVNVLLGQVITALAIDNIGRRLMSVSSLTVGGLSFIAIHFFNNYGYVLNATLSSIVMTAFSIAWSTASVMNIELFPTAFRCTSIGVIQFPGLILQMLAVRHFWIIQKWYPIIIGCLYLGAATAACFIKDLKRKPMFE